MNVKFSLSVTKYWTIEQFELHIFERDFAEHPPSPVLVVTIKAKQCSKECIDNNFQCCCYWKVINTFWPNRDQLCSSGCCAVTCNTQQTKAKALFSVMYRITIKYEGDTLFYRLSANVITEEESLVWNDNWAISLILSCFCENVILEKVLTMDFQCISDAFLFSYCAVFIERQLHFRPTAGERIKPLILELKISANMRHFLFKSDTAKTFWSLTP